MQLDPNFDCSFKAIDVRKSDTSSAVQVARKPAPKTDTRHEDKAKFGEVRRSVAVKKGPEKPGRGGEERTMISATAGTSASAVRRRRCRRRSPNRGVSSFTGRSARCRCRETCPTSVCACIGIHYPRPPYGWRGAPARRPARSFFRAIFFGPRGNICGSCEAVDRRRDSAPRTRQVLTFRGSPSPANYACLFLPLPLFSPALLSVFRPYERPPSLSFRPPPACPHGFFSHLLSLPFACTLPFLSSLPPSFLHLVSLGVDLLHSVGPRANFLHSSERFNTLHFSRSIIELQELLNKRILHVFFDEVIFSTTSDNCSLWNSDISFPRVSPSLSLDLNFPYFAHVLRINLLHSFERLNALSSSLVNYQEGERYYSLTLFQRDLASCKL